MEQARKAEFCSEFAVQLETWKAQRGDLRAHVAEKQGRADLQGVAKMARSSAELNRFDCRF